MATIRGKFFALVLFAVMPVAVLAQDTEQATREALDQLDQMSVEVNKFVGDVRFDEDDVTSLIELWDEYAEFGEDEYEYDDESDDDFDFESLLQDQEYRRWAASHGLAAEDWARKTVRITMMLYREHMLEAATNMPEQMAQQMAMIEGQREQLGEEMYQEIMQGMEDSARYGKALEKNARSLPEPTAAEQALLDKYRSELTMLMEADDEDEQYPEEYYGDDEYYDDEEYYEDDDSGDDY